MHRGTVLTTGASSGIGLETAIEVARLGFLSIGTVRTAAKGDLLTAAADAAGVAVEPVLLDVTDADRCEEVVRGLELVGVVNNAGYTNTGAIEDVDDEDVRHQLETMAVAPMRLARLALPAMRAAGRGRIVNVSSIYGRATTPLTGWYQASKHALEAASDALRMEVAGDGIQVVLVEPGGFKTGIWDDNREAVARHAASRYASAYDRELLLTRLSQPIMGDPSRVAKVIGRALTTRFPRARYLVGYDAQALAVVDRFTPTTVKDLVTRFTMGL
jgi:NAD(P)-dependent dehydrogenase (short-subunit alcohol dehydrogenase family)